MRLWIGLALIAVCAGTNLADNDWYDSYRYYDYPDSAENNDDVLNLFKELIADSNENDEKNNENTQNFNESLENAKVKPDESVFNDYQFEDNRSEPEDEQNVVLQDEQKDEIASTAYNERSIEKDNNYKVNPEIYGLGDEINPEYNNPPDTKQIDDENMYDMDGNSIVKPLDNENQNTLTENISEIEEDNENEALDIVNDTLNKVFDDAENAEEIQKTIESFEQSNQMIKDFAADVAEPENVFQDNSGDEQSEEIQKEAASELEIEPLSFREDFDEFQQPIVQDIDDEKLDKEIIERHEYDEDQTFPEDGPDTKEASKEQDQISQRDKQNDENSEEQIVEENINNTSEINDDKNEEMSNESEQYADENQAPNNDNFIESNGDSKDDAVDDYDDNLKQLFETWNKLQENDTIKEDDDENKEVEDDWSILDYEEKYKKPYRESNILSAREYNDETDDIDDDVKDLSEQGREINIDDETDEERKDYVKSNATSVTENSEKEVFVENDESFYRNSPLDKNNLLQNYNQIDEKINEDSVVLPTISEKSSEIEGKDEIFYRSGSSIAQLNATKDFSTEDENERPTETATEYYDVKSTAKAIDVDDLTPDQYEDLMKQFSIVHREDLEIKSGDYVAPIHFTLSADESVVVESPDYPENYPTNNVIDYYFDGLGTGIEFNITDFSVNGVLGDYLLVKPGGIDASGSDGLVLSYHLNEKRQYRFLSVDRLFVRFFAHPGVAMFKGYQFSVKMISPPQEDDVVLPEPEPLLPPLATHSVTLGGTSLQDFQDIKEDFRLIIADMATMYMNANNIEFGLNATSETTQITKTSICNVNWPSFESCVAVTFGVPLEYGDDDDEHPARLNEMDLRAMWETYVSQDPFATRLRIMGITEFDAPNDRRVLTVWLVIAAGVVISMAMLAFALWRFSCFEDYTRMAAYSDTDSINDKRVLDMYPTPHQTFPALYSEQQLKWDDDKFDDTTRVDMGGFANRSYVRDDAMDMDSDEDIITTPRDRNSFSPRDIYQV